MSKPYYSSLMKENLILVDNRNNIVEDLSPDDPRRVAADAILDANKRKR